MSNCLDDGRQEPILEIRHEIERVDVMYCIETQNLVL